MAQLTRTELAQVLVTLIEETKDAKQLAQAIASFLVEQRMTKDLDSLMRDVQKLRADRGLVEATATTAHPLGNSLRSEITELIRKHNNQAKAVIINEVTDTDVVGGIRIETDEQLLDTTVRTKLDKLKSAIA